MAQWVKNPPAVQEMQVQPLDGEDSLEEGMATHSIFLAWKTPWTESGGLQSMRMQRVRYDGSNWACMHTILMRQENILNYYLKVEGLVNFMLKNKDEGEGFPGGPVTKTLSSQCRGKWVTQSCPILCDPMDYTVCGILQARLLEWVAFPFSRGSSQPKDWTLVSRITHRFFTSWATKEAGDLGLIPGQGTRHHILQLRVHMLQVKTPLQLKDNACPKKIKDPSYRK